jgi:hypothetical protein
MLTDFILKSKKEVTKMNVGMLVEYSSVLLAVLCGICILISVITEFTKDLGFLKKIPTTLQVLFLSLMVCVTLFFMYISYKGIAFVWYYLVAIIFISFIVALITAKGWDYFIDIVKRFWKSKLPDFTPDDTTPKE